MCSGLQLLTTDGTSKVPVWLLSWEGAICLLGLGQFIIISVSYETSWILGHMKKIQKNFGGKKYMPNIRFKRA